MIKFFGNVLPVSNKPNPLCIEKMINALVNIHTASASVLTAVTLPTGITACFLSQNCMVEAFNHLKKKKMKKKKSQ